MVQTPADAAEAARGILAQLDADREHFIVLMLNVKHRLVGFKVIGSGTSSGLPVRPREIFRAALLLGAEAIIVAHNHPSGEPTPSREDLAVTQGLKQAGELVGIPLLDHVIIGAESFASLQSAAGL